MAAECFLVGSGASFVVASSVLLPKQD